MNAEHAMTDSTLYWCCGPSNDNEEGDDSLTEPKRVRIVEETRHGGVVREWVRVGEHVTEWKSCNRGLLCTRNHDPMSHWIKYAEVFATEPEAWDYYDAIREHQLRDMVLMATEKLVEFLVARRVRNIDQPPSR